MSSVILASASYDHSIKFWEAPSGVCYRTVQYTDSQVNTLQITPDKQYLVAGGNPHVRLFEINSNNPNAITSFDGHTSNVTAVGFHKAGNWMFTGSEDSTIKIWDLRAPGCQRAYECTAPVNDVQLHPNQSELISGDQNGNIRVWDLTANACSRELVPAGETAIRSVTLTSDGTRVAAANNKGECFIWRLNGTDTAAFEPHHKLNAHSTYILKCCFSPDGKTLATSSADHTVKIWNSSDFSLNKTLAGHQQWVWGCIYSDDSDFALTASSDTTVRLWDLTSGEVIRQYSGHQKAVVAIALNDSAAE